MRTGTSLTLIAIGAILAFAVHAHLEVISFFAVGVILMLVGAVGPLLNRTAASTRGIAVSRPSWTQPRGVESDTDEPPVVESDEDAVDPAPASVPQARASDSPWSSPRSGLRAI